MSRALAAAGLFRAPLVGLVHLHYLSGSRLALYEFGALGGVSDDLWGIYRTLRNHL